MGLIWQKVAGILALILLVAGTITYTDLFGALFQLKGINYTHSGDVNCGKICESYINVTTWYWRICFANYSNTKYEDEILFKKVSRSRTLHVNLDNIDNVISTEPRVEVDWLVPTYGNKWRTLKDGDCWNRLRKNKIKIIGHKEPEQTVKWGFKVGDYVDIDPAWIGSKSVVTDALLKNITVEGNFTHLNISNTVPYDSLVGYWSFDGDKESTFLTTHYDFSGLGNDGTGVNQANATSTGCLDGFGKCLSLDGVDDYVDCHSDSSLDITSGNVTYSVWVKANSLAIDDIILANNIPGGNNVGTYAFGLYDAQDEILLGITTAGKQWTLSDISAYITADKWHHWLIVYNIDTGNVFFWLDGIQRTLHDGNQFYNSGSGNDLRIGARSTGRNWNGDIDEVMIFNTSLTDAEILEIYNNQSARFKPIGTQQLNNQTYLNITSGFNRVNVTTSFQNNLNSNISLLLGYYDGSWSYTSPQNITGLNEYTITTGTTNLTLNFTFHAGNSSHPFYTPILNGSIILETWSTIVDTTAPTVALIAPANNSFWHVDNTPDFNYSAIDNVGITNCTLYINNTFNKSQTTNANFTNNPVGNGSYEWFVNCSDAIPNWGYSGFFNLTINFSVAVGDTCDCSSIQAGTTIDCTENCEVEACDASGKNIIFSGDGDILISGDITNHGNVNIINYCEVTCRGGCFKTN